MVTTIKRCVGLGLGIILLSVTTMAQEKRFTMEDVAPGGSSYPQFMIASLRQMQWNGDHYMYAKGTEMMEALPGKAEQVAFSLQTLNEALTAAGLEELKSLPLLTRLESEESLFAFTVKGHRLHYNYKENRIVNDIKLESQWQHFDYSEGSGYLAFTEKNNLYVVSSDNQVTAVTQEADGGIVCGQSVHQNEFGIKKGTYWSPKGNLLAFYRMDETMVSTYPLVKTDSRVAEYQPIHYPMAGMDSHHVTVGVYSLSTGKTVWLQTGLPKEKYLTNIAWSPDEKSIYIAELNRDQNHLSMVRYSAETGEREALLFEEKSDKYVEPSQPIRFIPGKEDQFIWQSDRDGFNHLYLYDTTGKLIRQLTSGRWVVQRMLGFDPKGEHLYITGTAPHPLSSSDEGSSMEVYGWQVNLKSGKRSCFTHRKGVHNLLVSPSGKYAIDQYSAPDVPNEIDIVRVKDGKETVSLLKADHPYHGYAMPEVVGGTLKAADEVTDLHYRLIKPVDMDPTKKYPVIIYVYGGPHSQQVTGNYLYGGRPWEFLMAQKGYVMFILDNRGTSNRGRDFEQVIHRQLGTHEMADQMKGVDFLKSLPYVDGDRIGVYGWSYGGFMSTNLTLTYPDIFKVCVAGGPVIDWKLYEIMYGERYMDRPQDNPEGYEANNISLKAGNLKGKMLLIHGANDPVVVWQHSLTLMKACVDARTYPDYFVYPGHLHNVLGRDRVHLHEKITRYFDENL